MDGRGRCHDNIFIERLWWTVKHEWVYLRPAANGIEQKRSLAEFFDWYICGVRIRRSAGEHWTKPISATSRLRRHRPRATMTSRAVNLWTVGCADPHKSAAAHKLHSTTPATRSKFFSDEVAR